MSTLRIQFLEKIVIRLKQSFVGMDRTADENEIGQVSDWRRFADFRENAHQDSITAMQESVVPRRQYRLPSSRTFSFSFLFRGGTAIQCLLFLTMSRSGKT
jgi:hypothetical protein